MQEMNPTAPPPPDAVLMQLLMGKVPSFCLGAIARLGVADHIADEPASVEEIAKSSGTHAPSLYRVLRILSAFGVFQELPGRQFSLAPAGRLLRSDAPHSLRNMAVMQTDSWSVQSYLQLPHSIRTGGDGTTKAFGKNTFELFRDIPDQAQTFHAAMTDFTAVAVSALEGMFDFSPFRRLADVGGGHGILLRGILARTPGLEGVLFDLPEVVAGAPDAPRLSKQGGSFFERVPDGCDAFLMKNIIHDWDDGSCRRVLALMRDVLAKTAPENGRVFVYDMLVGDEPGPTFAKLLDIEMLVNTSGGKERTKAEFDELVGAVGMEIAAVHPTRGPLCLIEIRLS